VLLLTPLLPGPAEAQESVLAIEFDFSNPGARSLGLGGAFAGLADDATAAFANPAGLVQLIEPEVSLEGRVWWYSTPYTEGGRLSGEPTGNGLDTTDGLRIAESSERTSGLSFISFVCPRKRWSLAVYRHQLARFEFSSETDGLFRSVPEGPPGAIARFSEQRSSVEFEIASYGLSGAYRLTNRLSLGAGVAYFDGTLSSTSQLYDATSLFDPNLFLLEDLREIDSFRIDSSDWGLNAGFLWEFAERWKMGGFFREGPEFILEAEAHSGPALPFPPGTLLFSASSPVNMPDVFGLGFSYRFRGDAVTVSLEWNRVEYATIVDSLDPNELEVTVDLEDGDEFHLGAEYVFVRSAPLISVRGGVWLDPDHRFRAADDVPPIIQALRPPGDDEIHLAAGVGFVFKRLQLDLGIDHSEMIDTASASLIFSF
jgi:long-subunit fatty acid transport protein